MQTKFVTGLDKDVDAYKTQGTLKFLTFCFSEFFVTMWPILYLSGSVHNCPTINGTDGPFWKASYFFSMVHSSLNSSLEVLRDKYE
jgi:hypothetical protein